MFSPVTEQSLLGKAVEKGILEFNIVDIRDYSQDKHHKADDYPFGGGKGLVMLAAPVFRALDAMGIKAAPAAEESADAAAPAASAAAENCAASAASRGKMIYMSPRGKMLDMKMIENLAGQDEITILCGHYEGIDQRIIDKFGFEEVSIGDYVLTGGELPAMVLIDAVARFIPGVLGTEECAVEDSIYTGLLEYDQYTKPREYEGLGVPEVLFNGNHKLIHLWQYENSLKRTKRDRPDLFDAYVRKHLPDAQIQKAPENELTKDEKKILEAVIRGE